MGKALSAHSNGLRHLVTHKALKMLQQVALGCGIPVRNTPWSLVHVLPQVGIGNDLAGTTELVLVAQVKLVPHVVGIKVMQVPAGKDCADIF